MAICKQAKPECGNCLHAIEHEHGKTCLGAICYTHAERWATAHNVSRSFKSRWETVDQGNGKFVRTPIANEDEKEYNRRVVAGAFCQ